MTPARWSLSRQVLRVRGRARHSRPSPVCRWCLVAVTRPRSVTRPEKGRRQHSISTQDLPAARAYLRFCIYRFYLHLTGTHSSALNCSVTQLTQKVFGHSSSLSLQLTGFTSSLTHVPLTHSFTRARLFTAQGLDPTNVRGHSRLGFASRCQDKSLPSCVRSSVRYVGRARVL